MKTDRTAVLWGTIIGITIVIVAVVVGFKFPYMRLPFTEWQQEALVTSVILCGLLIASYRKLWKTAGFWALLLAFAGANIAFYWMIVPRMGEEIGGPQRFLVYGIGGGVEFGVFALIVYRLYRRTPDTRPWTGPEVH